MIIIILFNQGIVMRRYKNVLYIDINIYNIEFDISLNF